MISELRNRVRISGDASITTDEFNMLQEEWIKRTKIEIADQYTFDIEKYYFSDKDISCNNATSLDLNLGISYEAREGFFSDGWEAETAVVLNRTDVIALAKHFKLTGYDLAT